MYMVQARGHIRQFHGRYQEEFRMVIYHPQAYSPPTSTRDSMQRSSSALGLAEPLSPSFLGRVPAKAPAYLGRDPQLLYRKLDYDNLRCR